MTGPLPASALLLQVTRADVTHMLRADALRLGLGPLLIAVGLARTDTLPLLFGAPRLFRVYLAPLITYVIVFPGIFLLVDCV